MKKILSCILVLAFTASCISSSKKATIEDEVEKVALTDSIPTIKPTSVEIMPDISWEEFENADTAYIDVYSTLYWEGCSWYCGGKVDTIMASSYHNPENNNTYNAVNAHDFNHHVNSEQSWRNNSRVKFLLLYYNDQPYKMLEFQDSRSLQFFDLDTLGNGPGHDGYPNWTLKFEIKEVYPGQKYEDCVIADFIFDGIDNH